MMNQHQKAIMKAVRSVAKAQEAAAKNHWRLQYHVSPPAYWMNDPNGFCFFQGKYHLFYQHHPYSPEWGPMHWGHATSTDLAFWEHVVPALAPGEDYDRDGCFSGSAIVKDDKLYLIYTGNVWTGDNHDTELKQVQCLAVSEDGVRFAKIPANPVISEAPEGDVHPHHFRDPKVWKHDEHYYCVFGSRTKEHEGQVLLYRSEDLMKWDFVGVIAKGERNFSFMWECPDFFHLDGHDVLMFSPQGVKPQGYLYHNVHQAGYMLGELDYAAGTYRHESFQLLDYGFDFYAPQTMVDGQGRRIMIAWMGMWESEMPEQAFGWAGAMTLPRQLHVEHGRIICKPVPELAKLRREMTSFKNLAVEGERELASLSGDCYEMNLLIDAKEASRFGVKVRVNEAEQEETAIIYDKAEGVLVFDRNKSGKGPGGIRKAPVNLLNNELRMRIFVDRSSVEVFVHDGEKVMTARVYPGEQSKGIRFFADSPIEIVSLQKWDLTKSIGQLQYEEGR